MYAKDIKKIYNALQDNCSRELFLIRLSHLVDGKIENLYKMWRISQLYSPYQLMDSELNLIKWDSSNFVNKQIILYSSESTVEFCLAALKRMGINISALCNVSYFEDSLCGIDHITSSELIQYYNESILLIYSNDPFHFYEIMGHFKYHGFNSNQMIVVKQVPEEQYFGLDFLPPSNDEIYIDVGCFDGNTILKFCDFCNRNYKKIYALEPDFKNYQKVVEAINKQQIQDVEIFCKGSWSESTILNFSETGTSSSHVDEDSSCSVEMITIDEVLNCGRASFIKMDVEGAEFNALRGAEKTIKKYKPRLAVCLYHKPDDIVDLPAYILSIRPDYKFYIRHHNLTDFCETVLYAI